MRSDIVPGAIFPDYELADHIAKRRMLDDLPKHCAVGTKRNAKGHTTSWIGYKLPLDVADGDIPVSGLLSSASLHDSQAAIRLATLTAGRLTNLYDLMDSAYDAPEIKQHSRSLAVMYRSSTRIQGQPCEG